MTISSRTSRSLFAAFIFVVAAAPTAAFAAVKIVDVMYNPSGVDEGREWIEVTNTGNGAVNIAGYRLFEGGVNHKLTVAVGTSSLAAGAKAIIATDPGQYAADYPNFTGAIFKSSFSLSNTGETISLKDASLAVVDMYSYTAPPVVKEPGSPKAPKIAKTTNKAAKTSSTTAKTTNQAASPSLALPQLPNISGVWLYGLGLAVLLILGAGAALYARPATMASETSAEASEFHIE